MTTDSNEQRNSERFTTSRKIILGVFTAIFVSACSAPSNETPAQSQPQLPIVSVAPVLFETITEWDQFTGRLEAPETVVLRPRVSGYIEQVAFTEGSLVQKGDLLFAIDEKPYKAEVSRLTAELKAAFSRLSLAKNDLKRAESLRKQNAISEEQLDNRAAERDQAAANVEATHAALQSAELNLSYARVTAPISGRISNAQITEGNYVTAGVTELTRLVSVDEVYAYFDADEQSYLKYQTLYQGDSMGDLGEYKSPAFLQLANEQDYSHLGALDFIDNQVNPQTGTIRVRATFSNAEHRFTPGLFARIKLAAQAPYNAVLVTDRAIGTDLNNKYVLVLSEENHVEYRGIELGPKVNDMRIIRSGLEAGDIIVVNGLQRVRPGVQVQPETVAMFSPDDLATLRDEQQLVENSMQRLSAPLTADQRGAALKSPALATDPRG
ncbi:RND superfamily HAE1 family efflux transporter inner membrane pump subunit [Oleiphilus messinensis]|uniref:RND superfamily HAE1 family efflux transporter inner membrane pump subunit n=1 Tax=Oleiphilus messinensis TaxID=141451 RepID=A0A1Y0IAJ3_9GAMM|nr:efflux RND transporter periplasmic adaptor subunit [Oleiphilus messinensis]ARU56444.1 RND superfamily HAE1 family efflux transporter inner membrane pump subunit [Oleiphilus messinensis]